MPQIVVPKQLNPLDDVAQMLGIKQNAQNLQLQQQSIAANQRKAAEDEMNQAQQKQLQAIFSNPASFDPQSGVPTKEALIAAGRIHPKTAADLAVAYQIDPKSLEDIANKKSEEQLRTEQIGNLKRDDARAVQTAADALARKNAEESAGILIPGSEANVVNPQTQKPARSQQFKVYDPATKTYKIETRYTDPLFEADKNTQNQTVDTAEGVMQYNPKTGRYDIRVGSIKPPAAKAGAGGDDEIQAYVGSLARGEVTPANVPVAIRGKVLEEAKKQGVSIMSDTERQNITGLDSAMSIIDDIRGYSEKIHTHEGLTARGVGLLRSGEALIGHDNDVSALQSKAGELAILIRALGEKGALAEGDVTRAIQLIPVSPSMTQTEAKNRLHDVEEILKKVKEGKVRAATQPLVTLPNAGGKAGIVIDPAGVEHQVSDVDAAIKLHPGTRRK